MEKGYILVSGIESAISQADIELLKKIFLKKVYGSFFILDPKKTPVSVKQAIKGIGIRFAEKLLKEHINERLLLNIEEITGFPGSVLFPFIQEEGSLFGKYYSGDDVNILRVLDLFIYQNFFYFCIIPFEGKYIFFTNLPEDDAFHLLEEDDEIKPVELHIVIPKIIDSLNARVTKKDVSLSELGIYFPLSMLGDHAQLRDRLKNKSAISQDRNFRNLIRYGLLNYLRLKSDYSITFYKNNEKNKLNLRGYLYDFQLNGINQSLLSNLRSFISDINSIANGDSTEFFNLPIYIIGGKYDFIHGEQEYPDFRFDPSSGKLELILPREGGVDEVYTINGIFPQFVKIASKGRFAYLHTRENIKPTDKKNGIENYEFEREHFSPTQVTRESCDTFLQEIRDKITGLYRYELDDEDEEGDPEIATGDLFLSAMSQRGEDCLINIVNPKKARPQRLTVYLYKLTSFRYGRAEVQQAMKKYAEREKGSCLLGEISVDSKRQASTIVKVGKDSIPIPLSFEYPTSKGNDKKSFAKDGNRVCKPHMFDYMGYIDPVIKYEDYLSLCLIELLKKNGHQAFFGGKKAGGEHRELADIISLSREESSDCLNLNLFHIKSAPFLDKDFSNLHTSFYQYTQVVGQALEKARPFVHFKGIDDVIDELRAYFVPSALGDSTPFDSSNLDYSSNYFIFQCISRALKGHKIGEINFNIYFSARKKDYFGNYPDSAHPNNDLAYETNWKRLKMVEEIFESNVGNVGNFTNPNLKFSLHLGMVVVEKITQEKTPYGSPITSRLHLLKNIGEYIG